MNPRVRFLVSVWIASIPCAFALAGAGDVTLRTDHPDYPGEGQFQTVEACVQFATAGKNTEQERALALYNWLLTHQFHLYSPQEWNVPGRTPGTNNDDYEMVVYDANRSRFSYGYGLCGTVHAWNEPYWRALGMNARRRAFPGHVNSEIEYGGSWHAFDTDMAGLVLRPDGVVAGYDDIKRDPSIVRLNDRGLVCYPFAWPSDFEVMKHGWQQIADGGNWYSMYNSGYAALPGVVHLRSGETFTRYFDRDHFGGPSKRRFWHPQKDGPFRNWTFVNMGSPTQREEKSNCRGNASYANAVFRYEPNLTKPTWREGAVAVSANLEQSNSGLTSSDNQAATVTFEHFSPYVICGDPEDDENPMAKPAKNGLVVRILKTGPLQVHLSVDQGQSWQAMNAPWNPTAVVNNAFLFDLTDLVKGRYGWWIRFEMAPESRLENISFETTCQVNQSIYPRLKPGGCEVRYAAKSRGVTIVKPNFGLSEEEATRNEVREMRSSNLRYTPRDPKQLTAYSTLGPQPADIVYRIDAPKPLVEITAAARYRVRSPQPAGCDFHLDYSIDGGNSWQKLARAVNAPDNEYSSGWMSGSAAIVAPTSTALVKVHLDGGGYGSGLIDFEAYGLHRTATPDKVEVTWAWQPEKSDEVQTHTEKIPVGATEHRWNVPTPAACKDAWVEIKAP